ncbi:MAG: lipopolysaccharide heptosyltransferase II [Deltaproteobacteria bacterium]|nr:lipopolysaccharide heptosyltransferase II [Deltaproteobacteria bacterium]
MQRAQISVPLIVRGNKRLPLDGIRTILVRGTNWIGDAVMTLPALAAIRRTWPQAQISVLAKPWVVDIYRESADVNRIVIFEEPGRHSGPTGKIRLAGELRQYRFDMAILLQNAIEAAIIARLAGIPIRAGYNSDVRGWLLTHSVHRTPAIRQIHQIDYYLEMVKALGCDSAGRNLRLELRSDTRSLADGWLKIPESQHQLIIGMAPGATYGPAKRWPVDRFAAVAAEIIREYGATIILFGSKQDQDVTDAIATTIQGHCLNLAGKTSVREVMALIARCHAFITNDSGLMHVAGAMNVPTVAIFGSTNPVTTSPPGERNIIIQKPVDCSPCLKTVCPTDFRCMNLIGVEEVLAAVGQAIKI